jgi:hypothetical protein
LANQVDGLIMNSHSRREHAAGAREGGYAMTRLLEQAVAEIEKLPDDAQDAIAARLLADLSDEQAWAARFAETTDAQWDRLAAFVRREMASSDTVPRDDILPPRAARP